MRITKPQIVKAISFLKTVPEKAWVIGQQTKNGSPENIGKFHCAIGHLSLNPRSPFYKKDHTTESGTMTKFTDMDFGCRVNKLASLKLGMYLSSANNGRIGKYKQSTPKRRSIALLKDLLK